jgi:hypothetical protein
MSLDPDPTTGQGDEPIAAREAEDRSGPIRSSREILAASLCDAMNGSGAWGRISTRSAWLHRADRVIHAMACRQWMCVSLNKLDSDVPAVPVREMLAAIGDDMAALMSERDRLRSMLRRTVEHDVRRTGHFVDTKAGSLGKEIRAYLRGTA